MKKNFMKYLSILLAAVMAFSTLTLVACNPNSFGQDTDTEATAVNPSLSFETKNSPFVSLSATSVTRATTNGNVLEHILTATVLPVTAENKEVDWTVNWEDTSRQEIVSSYVMLTPNTNGGNVATVTCLQPFTGNVIIEVTTREGGYTAQCICKYVGLPSTLEIDLTGASIVTDTDWNADIVEVGGWTENYYAINLSNVFGEVGESFTPSYDVTLEAHGGIYTKNTTYDADGNLTGAEQGEVALQVVNFYDTAGYCYAYFAEYGDMYNFINVRVMNGKLYVVGQNYPAAYGWENTASDGTTTKSVYDGYVDDMEPYVTVTLTEKTTGISYTFNVRTVGTVNNVNLDYDEIIF